MAPKKVLHKSFSAYFFRTRHSAVYMLPFFFPLEGQTNQQFLIEAGPCLHACVLE